MVRLSRLRASATGDARKAIDEVMGLRGDRLEELAPLISQLRNASE
jgi:hypothetical protein